jgi:predicted amidohydrolase
VQLEPWPAFAVAEVLWLWRFGPLLEATLTASAKGNRLRLANAGAVSRSNRYLFTYWADAYERFRADAISKAQETISTIGGCTIASFDLAAYYDSVDPAFLVEEQFVTQLVAASNANGIKFDRSEYVESTRSLLRVYGRFRAIAARATGVTTERGVPIGLLTSRVVANVTLAELDRLVSSNSTVRYYGRYVDDMIVVLTPNGRDEVSVVETAARLMPGHATNSRKGPRYEIDSKAIGRVGSRFVFQASKCTVHRLSEAEGATYLEAIRREMARAGSERRLFVDATVGDLGAFSEALGADPLDEAELQTLRDADRLSMRRHEAAMAVTRIDTAARLLSPEHSAAWSSEQLGPIARSATDWRKWTEYLDLIFRVLSASLAACDEGTALLVLRRIKERTERLRSMDTRSVRWNGQRCRRNALILLTRWLEQRTLESVCAALPFDGSGAKHHPLQRILSEGVTVSGRSFRGRALTKLAVALRKADLRYLDWEDDGRRGAPRQTWRGPPWTAIGKMLMNARETRARVLAISAFLSTCRRQRDESYSGLRAGHVLLMTRPPSTFDISFRWMQARQKVDQLIETINAIRGTEYLQSAMRQRSRELIEVGDAVPASKTRVILGNLSVPDEWCESAIAERPELSTTRVRNLARVVDLALRESARSDCPALLVLPELSLPRVWLRPLANHLVRHARSNRRSLSVIAGLEYRIQDQWAFNQAVAVVPVGYSSLGVCLWTKRLPAASEAKVLSRSKLVLGTDGLKGRLVLCTQHGSVGCLICSELLEIASRARLLGRVDLVVVPAWNMDTASFESVINSTALDLHTYVACANNGRFSDCRVRTPRYETYERDACRLIARCEDAVVACEIDVADLRRFQQLDDRDASDLDPKYKPVPPGFVYRRRSP